MIRGMSGGENFRDAIRIAFGFLKHRKLVGPDRLVFVDAGFFQAALGMSSSAWTLETSETKASPRTQASANRLLIEDSSTEGQKDRFRQESARP